MDNMASSSEPGPSPSLILFARGILSTLKLWPALRVAVEGGWGGPESEQKRTWLASAIVDSFEGSLQEPETLPDAIYVEEMLLQALSDEFDMIIEDGSTQQVSENIVKLWEDVMQRDRTDIIYQLDALVEQMYKRKVNIEEKIASDDEDEWDDEDEDASSNDDEVPRLLPPQQEKIRDDPEVDEDGFKLVQGRHKGHK